MTKKAPKVFIPDEVLARFPAEDRDAVRKQIEESFKDFDPDSPPGEFVTPLGIGIANCPECNAPLKVVDTTTLPEEVGGHTVDFLECTGCERPYERPAAN